MKGLMENTRERSGMLFPVALGILLTLGSESATKAYIPVSEPGFYVRLSLYVLICVFLFKWLYSFIIRVSNSDTSLRDDGFRCKLFAFSYEDNVKSILFDGLKIFICWAPYTLLLYPGIIMWDTGDQIAQFYGYSAFGQEPGQIFDHHPFFDTYLFGGVIKGIQSVTGSFEFGVCVFVILQLLFAANVFAWGLAYLRSQVSSTTVIQSVTLFVCLFPLFPIMYCSLVKDVIHSIVFLWWTVLLMKVVDSDLRILKNPRFLIVFFLVGMFCGLTKKTGLYIVLVVVLMVACLKGKMLLKFVLVSCGLIPCILISNVLPNYVYEPLNIVKAGSQSSIAVPIEMLARVAQKYPNDITSEEQEAVESYLLYSWDEIGDNYNPYIADPVTGFNVRDESKKADFLKAWVTIGLRHPLTYLSAFLTIESGWISFESLATYADESADPVIIPQKMNVLTATKMNPDTGGKIASADWSNSVNSMVNDLFSALSAIPVLNVLFYICVWTACLPIFCVYLLWRRKSSVVLWIKFAPYIISVLTLALYSVSVSANDNVTRYMFHTVILGPFYLAIALNEVSKKYVQ